MKQNQETKKEKKQRQKKPKKIRFLHILLRRLIPCLLAGGIVCAVKIRSAYHDWDDFTRIAGDRWEAKLDTFPVERAMSSGGLPAVLERLTDDTDGFMFYNSPFQDISVALFQPRTGEYLISEPYARLVTSKNEEDGTTAYLSYYADAAEAEQLAEEIRAYKQQHYIRFYFPMWLDELTGYRIEPVEDWCYNHYPFICFPYAYINGESFRVTEYSWMQHQKQLCAVTVSGEELTDEWREVTDPRILSETGLYDVRFHPNDAELPAGTEYIKDLSVCGFPANSPSGYLMREAMGNTAAEYSIYQRAIAEMQAIIDDTSGKKREQYYREQYEIIVEQMKADDEQKQNGEPLYHETKAEVPSPEERIEQYYKEYAERPIANIRVCCGSNDKPAIYKDYNYYWDSREITLKDKTYTILCIQSVNVRGQIGPACTIQSAVILFAAVLLALLWTAVVYLRARRKYETDEYRRSLTAVLAHDLKSPLTAISGYAENLDSGVHPEKQKHYIASILENADYMDRIITNSLELSRLEQNDAAKKQWVDLIPLMQEHLAHRQDEITEREIKTQITGTCFFYADPLMMTQAVRNLLDNAVKFTPDGGSITVTGEERALRVVNSIREEKVNSIDRLCEAFVKGDSARSNRKGTGLGLSVVRQAAALNKLLFRIESSGHTFTALLRDKPLLFRRIRFRT